MKLDRILLSITSYNYNYYINQDEIAIFGKIIIKFPTFMGSKMSVFPRYLDADNQ